MIMHPHTPSYPRFAAFILLLIGLSVGLSAAENQETGASVMEKVAQTQKASSSAMDIQMTLIDGKSEDRVRRIQTLSLTEGDVTKTITIFLTPASVKNTRFLTIARTNGSDDQWIFLPALGKVKRIAASETGGSFMGSDFTYADMASTTYATDEAAHTLLRTESYEGRLCHVVQSIPFEAKDYGRTVTWIDTERYVVMQVEFYQKDKQTLQKRLESADVRQVGNRWMAYKMIMNTLSSGHRTQIEILQAKFDLTLPTAYFTVAFLETGRI
jgi:outer membrane lipoprotein-sorting protein